MIINHDFGGNRPLPSTQDENSDLGLTLLVGLKGMTGLHTIERCKIGPLEMTAKEFLSLGCDGFNSLSPRLILSPLVCNGLDVLDFAGHLETVKFTRRYRVLVRKLPDARMILREVYAVAPNVDIGVTELSGIIPFSSQSNSV
jgi:hypothetical protein